MVDNNSVDENTAGKAPENSTPEPAAADTNVPESPSLAELEEQGSGAEAKAGKPQDLSLEMLLDVNVSLAIELGRVRLNIRDLLKLNQGSIVELDRMAGEPLDVLVNGTLVARGEVVVVKDKFGLMLTEVVSPEERIRRLR